MSNSLNLFRLQKIDSQIEKIKIQVSKIEKILNDDRLVGQALKKVEKVKGEEKIIRLQLNKIEHRVEAQRHKQSLSQAALFGGKIKNPKELQDLEMESEALKRNIAQLEDQQLDLMLEHELAEKNLENAERALAQVKEASLQENSLLMGERSSLLKKLERINREKEAVDRAITAPFRMLYDNLREKKNGIAVVAVIDGSCGICGQSITQADQQRIKSSSSLVYCPSCGRILYIE